METRLPIAKDEVEGIPLLQQVIAIGVPVANPLWNVKPVAQISGYPV
jgi:hypothetical protein